MEQIEFLKCTFSRFVVEESRFPWLKTAGGIVDPMSSRVINCTDILCTSACTIPGVWMSNTVPKVVRISQYLLREDIEC